MKKSAQHWTLSFILTVLWLICAHAQPTHHPTTVETRENREYRLYKKFFDTYLADPASAYVVAKQYLDEFAEDNDRCKYLKRWTIHYEGQVRRLHFKQLFREENFDEA